MARGPFVACIVALAALVAIAAALATRGGLETWYVGAGSRFRPAGCSEFSQCGVRRGDYINCGSLFDQSPHAVDPNCQSSLGTPRGGIILGYGVALLAALGIVAMCRTRVVGSRQWGADGGGEQSDQGT